MSFALRQCYAVDPRARYALREHSEIDCLLSGLEIIELNFVSPVVWRQRFFCSISKAGNVNEGVVKTILILVFFELSIDFCGEVSY